MNNNDNGREANNNDNNGGLFRWGLHFWSPLAGRWDYDHPLQDLLGDRDSRIIDRRLDEDELDKLLGVLITRVAEECGPEDFGELYIGDWMLTLDDVHTGEEVARVVYKYDGTCPICGLEPMQGEDLWHVSDHGELIIDGCADCREPDEDDDEAEFDYVAWAARRLSSAIHNDSILRDMRRRVIDRLLEADDPDAVDALIDELVDEAIDRRPGHALRPDLLGPHRTIKRPERAAFAVLVAAAANGVPRQDTWGREAQYARELLAPEAWVIVVDELSGMLDTARAAAAASAALPTGGDHSYQVLIRDAGTYEWETCYYWNAPEAQECGWMDDAGAEQLLGNALTSMLAVLPIDEQIELLTSDLCIVVSDPEGESVAEHTRRADHYCRGCGHVSSWLDDDHDCEAG